MLTQAATLEWFVFPAPAGMNRESFVLAEQTDGVPCARRDEPVLGCCWWTLTRCSLRPQG